MTETTYTSKSCNCDYKIATKALSKGMKAMLPRLISNDQTGFIKDGAYYCYCAYVLRISTHSDFLSVMLTKTGIFLRGLKLSGESRP